MNRGSCSHTCVAAMVAAQDNNIVNCKPILHVKDLVYMTKQVHSILVHHILTMKALIQKCKSLGAVPHTLSTVYVVVG